MRLKNGKTRRHKYNARGLHVCPKCWSVTTKDKNHCHPDVKSVYFHSTGEYQRFLDLRLLEMAGVIQNLERQVRFDLDVNGKHIGRYTADFRYTESGEDVVEDFKGFDSDASKLRRKLTEAIHGVEVKIVKRAN